MGVVNGWDVNLMDVTTNRPAGIENNEVLKNATYCTFRCKKSYAYNCFICKSPTSNCQLCSFGSMNAVIEYSYRQGGSIEDCLAVMRECFRLCGWTPLLILIDVRQNLCPDVEAIFTNANVVLKSPYTSSNRSQMCLYLVKMPPAPVVIPPPATATTTPAPASPAVQPSIVSPIPNVVDAIPRKVPNPVDSPVLRSAIPGQKM